MNLRCKVCDEKAAGFHFGAFTCEGCKSFFGRCCNNMSIIGECRNNKECTINKKNRTSCKACRLQKCLQVGMSKSGSRYGRRSNWFKQYFQETEHQIKSPLSNHDYEIENSTFDQIKLTDLTNASTSERPSPVAVPDTHIRNKISPFDLYATAKQPLFSSHLYLNYFPALGLNRLVSYKHSGLHGTFVNTENAATAAAFFVPSTLPFSKLLQATEHNNVDDYLEKIFVAKYDGHDNDDDEMYNDNNPLDLSSKRSSKDGKYTSKRNEMELSKRTSPLDLSVK